MLIALSAVTLLLGTAASASAAVTFTSIADFEQGTITDLQLPPGLSASSPAADLRLGGASPAWQAQPGWNAPGQGMKSYTSPVLCDLDGDGLLDLLVGRKDGQTLAYRDSGAPGSPLWTRQPLWDPPAQGPGEYAVPSVADLDGDGDLDLAIGRYDQQTWAYRNDGTSSDPVWSRRAAWDPPALTDTNHAAPAFVDLNGDNLADLVIGANDDRNLAYQNTGAAAAPTWTRKAAWDAPAETSRGWTQLCFGDLDSDQLPDLILGDSRGTITMYRNSGSMAGPVWSTATQWNPPQANAYAVAAVGNLDDDRDLDLMLGCQRGTLDGMVNADAGAATSGSWLSPVLDAGSDGSVWSVLDWSSRSTGAGASILVEARTAANPAELDGAPWSPAIAGALPVASLQRYVQARVTLTTSDPAATPVLEALTLGVAAPLDGLVVTGAGYHRGNVNLSWALPAGVAASTFEIYRDGQLQGTSTSTTFVDRPGRVAWKTAVTYVVVARDAGGVPVATGSITVRGSKPEV